MTTYDTIRNAKIIAIARGVDPAQAVKLAQALYNGGVHVLEFTFNMCDVASTATDEAIRAVCDAMGDKMVIGCGTCTYPALVDRAHRAGGSFVISADMNIDVIKRTKELGMVSIPGVMTASEAMAATAAGADFVKVFPAGELGANYIKSLKSPLSHIGFMAVGGIDIQNINEFLKAGCIGVGVGGALVRQAWIDNNEFDKISALATEYVTAINEGS